MTLHAVFEKVGVVGTVTVGIHLEEIVVAGYTADAAAAVEAVGEEYRLVDYDWDFAIENGADYCVAVASGAVGVD